MMKSLKMGKMLGTMRRRHNTGLESPGDPQGDSPEAIATQNVRSFVESGGQNNQGDEVTFLPPLVDAAESSPQAAAQCAYLIRKYLKKDYRTNPYFQYNAIMLMRILADNPGETFTRNLDQKFVDTVKELLRTGRNPSVHQILMETLEAFERTKGYDEGLALLIDLWRSEKEKSRKANGGRSPPSLQPRTLNAPPYDPHSQNYFARNHHNPRLPPPAELASRLEEARTSANVLQEVITNTPPGEVLQNDLIKEFADRCTSASRSIERYMRAEDPAPDNDTMESLIDTNEQLHASLSLHQRAMLNARKMSGLGLSTDDTSSLAPPSQAGSSSRQPSPHQEISGYDLPPMPPLRQTNGKGKGKEYDYDAAAPGPSRSQSPPAGPSRSQTPPGASVEHDPFRDPDHEEVGGSGSGAGSSSSKRADDEPPRLAFEPYHPGFSTTTSYVGRQESAVGKEAMHGAVVPPSELEGSSPTVDKDEELYDVTPPRSKQPMYRY